jgi:hypothetical protein
MEHRPAIRQQNKKAAKRPSPTQPGMRTDTKYKTANATTIAASPPFAPAAIQANKPTLQRNWTIIGINMLFGKVTTPRK